VITPNLASLPKMVAAAQSVLALNGLSFGLTEATSKKLEEQRIAAAYQNLTERISAIAKAMGRSSADAVLDTIDFEASGNYAPSQEMANAKAMRSNAIDAVQVQEPNFEPGETILSTRVVAKVKFK